MENRLGQIAEVSNALRIVIEELERLGLFVAAALASQALDAAREECCRNCIGQTT